MKRPHFLTFLLAAAAIGFPAGLGAQTPSVKSSWNVRDHIPLKDFIIQSHRGAGELAEENTLEAFELGWSLGTIPESDVRTTRDGVIVAFHDNDFSRVVKGIPDGMKKKGVADVSYDDLMHLDVGSWKGDAFKGRRVCRMKDIYERMAGKPERRLYLDFKNVDLKQLSAEIKAAGVERQVILASSKHAILRDWKALVPESGTLLWISGTEAEKRKVVEAARATGFAGITQIQIHVRLPGDARDVQPGEPFSPSRAFLAELSPELAKRGILFQTLPYGVTDPDIYHQLLDAGLASFATDHPKVTLDAVRSYYEAQTAKPKP
ncbi:MAG: glycerophosphodiester phosphodiesterase family protein [Verrucomicrobiota bacterium]